MIIISVELVDSITIKDLEKYGFYKHKTDKFNVLASRFSFSNTKRGPDSVLVITLSRTIELKYLSILPNVYDQEKNNIKKLIRKMKSDGVLKKRTYIKKPKLKNEEGN